jgi:hypothetical protein
MPVTIAVIEKIDAKWRSTLASFETSFTRAAFEQVVVAASIKLKQLKFAFNFLFRNLW